MPHLIGHTKRERVRCFPSEPYLHSFISRHVCFSLWWRPMRSAHVIIIFFFFLKRLLAGTASSPFFLIEMWTSATMRRVKNQSALMLWNTVHTAQIYRACFERVCDRLGLRRLPGNPHAVQLKCL